MRRLGLEGRGAASGPIRGAGAGTRLAGAALVFAACVLAPRSIPGAIVLVVSAGGWVAACGVSGRLIVRLIGLSLLMFLPLPLLAAIAHWTGIGTGPRDASGVAGVAAAGWVAARGAACLLVATSTAAAIRPWDLQDGLSRLPLPSMLVALIVQIVRQAGTLVDEVARMSAAVRVRGGVGGWQGAWRVASALPMSWLPRVADRAERVSRAMEARDFDGLMIPVDKGVIGRRDLLWLSMTTGWVLLVVALRLVEGG